MKLKKALRTALLTATIAFGTSYGLKHPPKPIKKYIKPIEEKRPTMPDLVKLGFLIGSLELAMLSAHSLYIRLKYRSTVEVVKIYNQKEEKVKTERKRGMWMLAILVPALEELMFRAFPYIFIKSYYPYNILQSSLFGWSHFPFDDEKISERTISEFGIPIEHESNIKKIMKGYKSLRIGSTAFAGGILGYIFYNTNIWNSMLVHLTANFAVLGLSKLFGGILFPNIPENNKRL